MKLRFILLLVILWVKGNVIYSQAKTDFVSYKVDASKVKLYWKDDSGNILQSIAKLKGHVESKRQRLIFAMNGGMYQEDRSALGLFIKDGKQVHALNTRKTAYGNFYMQPNGVFYTTKQGKAVVCKTEDFRLNTDILYATQSGPMLVIDGKIHPAFNAGSTGLNVRNAVGILPDGKAVFVISSVPVNLYSTAKYFIDMGCRNALFLDGFVSRMYLPEKGWKQMDGEFGVMIGVVE